MPGYSFFLPSFLRLRFLSATGRFATRLRWKNKMEGFLVFTPSPAKEREYSNHLEFSVRHRKRYRALYLSYKLFRLLSVLRLMVLYPVFPPPPPLYYSSIYLISRERFLITYTSRSSKVLQTLFVSERNSINLLLHHSTKLFLSSHYIHLPPTTVTCPFFPINWTFQNKKFKNSNSSFFLRV